MRARVLLVALLALSAAFLAAPASGQVAITVSSELGMGFGPGSVSPIADGVPVYATGDQLWAESYSSGPVTVDVVNPTGTGVAERTLMPMSPALIRTFSSADEAGSWALYEALSGGTSVLSFVTDFTLVGNESVQPSMTGYRLTGEGALTMNYSLAAPGAYDISACLVRSGSASTVSVPVPSVSPRRGADSLAADSLAPSGASNSSSSSVR